MALGRLWWRAWFPFGAVVAAAVCMAGVALKRHRPALCVAGLAFKALGWLWWRAWFPFGAFVAVAVCVAGVALGDIDRHFAWQAWHLRRWASRLAPLWPWRFAWQAWRLVTSTSTLRGRRSAWRHRSALSWQAWHLWCSCSQPGKFEGYLHKPFETRKFPNGSSENFTQIYHFCVFFSRLFSTFSTR